MLRLAALLHDIGKPRTRSLLPGGRVAFHHHEVVGAKMASKRLTPAALPQGDRRRRQPAHRAAPAVPRLRRGRLDRLGRTPVRHRRRAAADPAARADQGRLHDQEQGQGAAPGSGLRRPGGADRRAGRAGGAGQPPAGPGRQRDHGDPRHPAWARWSAGPTSTSGSCGSRSGPLDHDAAVQNCCAGPRREGLDVPPHPVRPSTDRRLLTSQLASSPPRPPRIRSATTAMSAWDLPFSGMKRHADQRRRPRTVMLNIMSYSENARPR